MAKSRHKYAGTIIIICGTCKETITETESITEAQKEAYKTSVIIKSRDGLHFHHPECVKDIGTGSYARLAGGGN